MWVVTALTLCTFFLWPILLWVVIAIFLLSRVIWLGLQVLLALLDDLPLLFWLLLGRRRRLLMALQREWLETDVQKRAAETISSIKRGLNPAQTRGELGRLCPKTHLSGRKLERQTQCYSLTYSHTLSGVASKFWQQSTDFFWVNTCTRLQSRGRRQKKGFKQSLRTLNILSLLQRAVESVDLNTHYTPPMHRHQFI